MTETKKVISTSLMINPEVWKAAKIAAIENGIELQELVDQAIREYLDQKKLEREEEESHTLSGG